MQKFVFVMLLTLVISLSTGTAKADGPYSSPGCSAPTTTQQQSYNPSEYWCWGSGWVFDFPAGVGYFADDGNCGPGQGYNAPCGECVSPYVKQWWYDGTCGPNQFTMLIKPGHISRGRVDAVYDPDGMSTQPIDDRAVGLPPRSRN